MSNAQTSTQVDTMAELHAEATRRCGFTNFGPDDYQHGLRMLIEAMDTAPMSDLGRTYWREELVLALVARAAREAGWQKYPQYKHRKLEKPLIICGIPRTGTTALHKVLSLDPQFQGLENWLTAWPQPRPPRSEWEQTPGYQYAVDIIRARTAQLPEMAAQHEVLASEVDECLEILRLDFVTNRFASMTRIPEYDAWFQAQDERPFYKRLADTLRLIGLNDDRTWLLKNPGHFVEIEALLTVFPDARVVITHRDPVKSLGSLASILSHSWRLFNPDADVKQLGPRDLAYWSKGKRNMERVRAKQPKEQFYDVDHSRFHADPIAAVRGIYDHFGLKLTSAVEQAMRDWLAANPAGKHGEHRYNLEDFGITPEQVRTELQNG